MNEQPNLESDMMSMRYNISLSIRNFREQVWIDFELFRSEMDAEIVKDLINAAGFNENHPEYQELVSQVHQTFTICEMGEFFKCLSEMCVMVTIEPAILHVLNSLKVEKGVRTIQIQPVLESFKFSDLEGYSLPFEIVGHYQPSWGWPMTR